MSELEPTRTPPRTWIDTNAHFSADGRWMGRAGRGAGIDGLRRSMQAAGVARAVLVGLDTLNTADEVLDVAENHAEFLPVVGFDPAWAEGPGGIEERLRSLRARGCRGVKVHCRLSRIHPMDGRVLDLLAACGPIGLPVLFCSHLHGLHPVAPGITEVVESYATTAPETTLLIMHGGMTRVIDLFELARQFDNVHLDLSFTINRYAGSSVDSDLRFVFENLDRKVTVGSDFPEYSHGETLARFESLSEGIAPEKVENVLQGTARRVFGAEATRRG